MKILHVVTAFPRSDADVITPWLGRLLLGLREAGHEPAVLAPAYRGGGATRWRGIPVRRFRYAPAAWETLTHDETAPDRLRHRPWYAALLPGYVLGGAFAAFRAGLERPDIVHVHWPVPHAIFGALVRLASGGRTKLVASYYSVEIRWVERRLPALVPFLRWTVETADAVTAISTATADAVRRLEDRPVAVIPFAAGIDPGDAGTGGGDAGPASRVALDGAPHASSPEGAGGAAGPEILFVGRLVERKGVEVLVRALGLLEGATDARLTIVGEGSREGRIRDVIGAEGLDGRVALAGRVSDAELAAAYGRASLFVLPAIVDAKGDTEGLGVVLLEALRFGVPVIGSRAGGIPDIIIDGETGWLVVPGDPEDLARAIDQALGDPREAARRVERGREHVERGFTLPGVVSALLRAYGDVAAGGGSR